MMIAGGDPTGAPGRPPNDGAPPARDRVLMLPESRLSAWWRRTSPLRPPGWAAHSVAEDGGVTHELISRHRPTGTVRLASGVTIAEPTEISLSVFDHPRDGRWTRSPAHIQVEGGSYSLTEAQLLARAITELLHRTAPGG